MKSLLSNSLNIILIVFINSCRPNVENAVRSPDTRNKIPTEGKKPEPEKPAIGQASNDADNAELSKKSDIDKAEAEGVDPLEEPAKALSFAYKGAQFPADWTSALVKAVPELVPELMDDTFVSGKTRTDILSVCPNYFEASTSQKPKFWALFIASIAYPESGYKPSMVFREPPPLNENSVGLLQLSTSNGGHGEACKFKSESQLKEAVPNLRCGLLILKNQIKKHHSLFTPGYFYYWSVLRSKPEVIKDVFSKNMDKLSICKKR